jgi:hypothetical protein
VGKDRDGPEERKVQAAHFVKEPMAHAKVDFSKST